MAEVYQVGFLFRPVTESSEAIYVKGDTTPAVWNRIISGGTGEIMPGFGSLAPIVLIAAAALPLCAQQPAPSAPQNSQESAHDLVRDVIYNELHDRERDSHWEYRSECVSPAQNVVREQVETANGPVFRLLSQDGKLLDAAQQEQESERLEEYIHNPGQIAHVERAHDNDEAQVAAIMQMVPSAYLFDYASAPTDDVGRITFRPDPAFVPTNYQARIVHALTGTMIVDLRLKRAIDMSGSLAERVDFGYGLLGHVEKGSSFHIHRHQVSATHWKADLIETHVQGKVLLVKSLSKDQREVRSDFRPVPSGTTLAEAKDMLTDTRNQATDGGVQARLVPAAATQK
jgi:hypothetical protein